MCGLAGYIALSRTDIPCDEALLNRLHTSIAHRGPDGYGIWISDNRQQVFVHRRLKIIDLSQAGAQPMMDSNKSVVLVFNGEIYNYQELRALLEHDGYSFSSQTDTEVIIYAYKKWGIACLDHLDGMFAFALYDLHTNELYLVRDRIGIKPLYFSVQSQILSFASEIKALWELPWMEKQIKQEALSYYLSYLAIPAPMTLYEGVYKLPPGSYLKCDVQRTMTFHHWYDPVRVALTSQMNVTDEQFHIESLRTLFDNAVKKRMYADVPVGIFLSGGIDSSLNLAYMARHTSHLKSFTISFADNPELQECAWARKMAQQCNTEHHELIISEEDAFNSFEKIIHHQDEPLGDPVCIPLYHIAQYAKKMGVTVVHMGEGSDELFCGYNAYADYIALNRYWQLSQNMVPQKLRQGLAHIASWHLQTRPNKMDMISRWAQGKDLFYGSVLVFSETWKTTIMHDMHINRSRDPIIEQIYANFPQHADSYAMVDYYRDQLRMHDNHADFVKMMGYIELKHRLSELLLMRVDRMTMAAGVEGRVPFLDYKLVEYALQIPASLKYKNGTTKYILKKACEGIVPHDIIYRKKIGFNAPTTQWFKSGKYFKTQFHDMMHATHTDITHMLNMPVINKLFNENVLCNQVDYAPQLWALFNVLACTK